MKKIGTFGYHEPEIPQIRRPEHPYPRVTLFADASLELFFPQFKDYVNAHIDLELKRDHEIHIEQLSDRKFKFHINAKTIRIVDL